MPPVPPKKKPPKKKEPRRAIDWDGMEEDWRVGHLTLSELSRKYSVSRAAIEKHWKNLGIERDLKSSINAEANSIVQRQETGEEKPSQRKIIEANAGIKADVMMMHRKDSARARNLVLKLFGEIESITDNVSLFEQLGEVMFDPDDKGTDKQNQIYRSVISLAGRADTAKKLTESLRIAVELERKAHGIKDENDEGGSGIESFLKNFS